MSDTIPDRCYACGRRHAFDACQVPARPVRPVPRFIIALPDSGTYYRGASVDLAYRWSVHAADGMRYLSRDLATDRAARLSPSAIVIEVES